MGLLLYLATLAIIALVILWLSTAFVFWIAGRIVSGMNTTFKDALIVAFVGALVNTVLQSVFEWLWSFIPLGPLSPYETLITFGLTAFITLLVYIPLIMKFFDVGLGGAILVGILVIIFGIIIGIATAILLVIIGVVLALILIPLPGP